MNAQVAFGFSVDQFLNPFTSKARKKLSRGYSLVENSRGGEGLMFPCANGKSEGVEGSYLRFPPWWGSGYFLEIHIKKGKPFEPGTNCKVENKQTQSVSLFHTLTLSIHKKLLI